MSEENTPTRRGTTAERLERKIDQLHIDLREVSNLLNASISTGAATKARLEGVAADVERLNVIVRDGNGHPSVLSQLSALQRDRDADRDAIKELKGEIHEQKRGRTDYKRNLWVNVITAVVGLAGGALGWLVSYAMTPSASQPQTPPAVQAPR